MISFSISSNSFSPLTRIGDSFIVDGNDEEKRYDLDVLLGPLFPGYERKVPEGTVTMYTCNKGYQVEGNRRTVCLGGQWIGNLPNCTGRYMQCI